MRSCLVSCNLSHLHWFMHVVSFWCLCCGICSQIVTLKSRMLYLVTELTDDSKSHVLSFSEWLLVVCTVGLRSCEENVFGVRGWKGRNWWFRDVRSGWQMKGRQNPPITELSWVEENSCGCGEETWSGMFLRLLRVKEECEQGHHYQTSEHNSMSSSCPRGCGSAEHWLGSFHLSVHFIPK